MNEKYERFAQEEVECGGSTSARESTINPPDKK